MMGAHAIVHWRPDVSLKAHVENLRLASTTKWRLTVKRVASMRAPAAAQRPWMTETEAKARRVRNLMNDNPSSG
jgi:hypothetical protein